MGEGWGEGSQPLTLLSSLYMPRRFSRKPTHPTDRATNNAAILRASTTPPEAVLWSKLKSRQLNGLKFRRQHPIGPYVVDFYCARTKLVIEVDSSYHDGRQIQDANRDEWMNAQSITIFRVSASELAKNEEGVLTEILSVSRRLLQDRELEK
jgi:very-short-patch-repair endonuclease